MKNLTGTYQFPQFTGEIVNPTMEVISKTFVYASDITQVAVKLSVSGASFGVVLEATNAQGGSQALTAIEAWAETQLNNYKI